MSEVSVTVADVLASAVDRLHPTSPTARLDAELLTAGTLERPRSFLVSHAGEALSPETRERIAQAIDRKSVV